MPTATKLEGAADAAAARRAGAPRVKPTTLLKLGVTLGLTLFVIARAGVDALYQTLLEAEWGWVVLGVGLAAVAMVINVVRWKLMLQGQGARASLASLIRLYLIGLFFNNVLPSRFGGDVVRAYGASLLATTKIRSLAAVLMDRLVGAISVLVLGMIAILLDASRLPAVYLRVTTIFFVISLVALVLMLYRDERLAVLRLRLLALTDVRLFGLRLRPRIEEALNALRSYSRARGVVVQGFAISLVANGLSALNLYLYARAVRAEVGLGDVATIAPFILAVGLLPISINGIGTIEATFALLFSALGVDVHVAIAIAILRRLALLVLSLAGGALYAARRFA